MAHVDRESALRADVEWLNALSDALHDAEYAAILDYITRQPAETFPPDTNPKEIVAFCGFGQDSWLAGLVGIAMKRVDFSICPNPPTDILWCYSAIPTLNGFCLKTPNLGAPAVVLNHGLISYIASAVHLTMGLTSWGDSTYCEHFPTEAIMGGLFELAAGIQDKRPAILLNIEAVNCLGTQEHASSAMLHHGTCFLAELFIIFHELGHITLGHLNAADVTYAFGEEIGASLPVFNRSQRQEFDADSFAFRRLVEMSVESELLERDIAYAIGCLLMLMRVVEKISPGWRSETHPSAVLRWQSLKTGLTDAGGPAAFDSIDYFFEWIDRLWTGDDDQGSVDSAGQDG